MARPRKPRTQAPEQSAAPVEPDRAPPVPAADPHPAPDGGTPLSSLHEEPSAAEGEAAAPSQVQSRLIVRARHPIGRRRAGRSFGPGETTIPLDALSEADREAIESDPMLIVRVA
ncbi:hypothetical protein GJ689_23130 [Rhodoplanes serenus]|uniref:Mu-like prophage FluMu N-terminal domain-containing protein n=1 Tax=Rhodoplanes serenus TaxID=200615 RepID=A0A9X5AU56_9BRAD|nr:hypothetical protein [Rhodoplanes serenus]MTW19096.1 hypothetical protein [Rhodoplanes serenus]